MTGPVRDHDEQAYCSGKLHYTWSQVENGWKKSHDGTIALNRTRCPGSMFSTYPESPLESHLISLCDNCYQEENHTACPYVQEKFSVRYSNGIGDRDPRQNVSYKVENRRHIPERAEAGAWSDNLATVPNSLASHSATTDYERMTIGEQMLVPWQNMNRGHTSASNCTPGISVTPAIATETLRLDNIDLVGQERSGFNKCEYCHALDEMTASAERGMRSYRCKSSGLPAHEKNGTYKEHRHTLCGSHYSSYDCPRHSGIDYWEN